MDDSKIVFINYLPGSFGSFLSKCLSTTSNVFLRVKDDSFFDANGASHYDITEYLEKFHDIKDIEYWANLSNSDKIKYLNNVWNPSQDFLESNLFYVHRLTVPHRTKDVMEFFPNAKFIQVVIPNSCIKVVLHQYTLKISPGLKEKGENLEDVGWQHVVKYRNNDIIDGVYNFDISHLFDNTFLEEFSKMCKWLNFQESDVSELYTKFKKLHGITNEK